MNKWWAPVLAIVMFVSLLMMVTNMAMSLGGETVTWSELKGRIEAGEIEEVVLEGELVRATVRGEEKAKEVLNLVLVRSDESFIPLLEKHDVPYRAVRSNCQNGSIGLLLLPIVAIAVLWILLARQGGPTRGAAAFGRSSANLVPEEGTGVTFADVAGVEEAAEELQEVIAFLTRPEKFTALGGRPPKGVLLVGPPGTGKTLIARAVAGEAGVPFFSISGSSFVEMFVGVGAARVRDLFKNATEHAPCIIFIDELDAVGKARGLSGPAGNEEREQTLNQLLVEMDGFDNRKGIIVMAATNRPETLDRALLRAGRFDRQVLVDRPDVRGREAVLRIHATKLKLDDTVDLNEIARMTPGFAGADLANALNEAALLAARREREAVTMKDIQDAIERTIAGLEKKNRRLSPKEKRVVSYHECGHAICAAASPGADPVQKISIIPRGVAALGYTIQMPLEDRYLMTKGELLNRITVLYGGRVAESIVFGDITTGAHDDIQKATDIARRMVVEYGMTKRVGPLNYAPEAGANAFGMNPTQSSYSAASATTTEAIEGEVRRITDACYRRAFAILVDNRPLLEDMAEYLLEHEVLDGDKMKGYLDRASQADVLADPPTAEVPKASVT